MNKSVVFHGRIVSYCRQYDNPIVS
jgi:hypothetical protein